MSSYAYDSSNDALELIAGIPRSRLNALEENQGDAFEERTSSNPYLVGDYCIYNNTLYKCTTEHYGAWNASHFTIVSIGDELKTISSSMNQTSVNKAGTNQGYVTTTLNSGTSLDDAVGTFLNNDISLYAKSVEKNDYVNIDLGSSLTNNTGNTIKAGTYFYSFGAVCRAKTDIANNESLTPLNKETTRTGNGALNEINSALNQKSSLIYVDSNTVSITCPSQAVAGQTVNITIPSDYTVVAYTIFTTTYPGSWAMQLSYLDKYNCVTFFNKGTTESTWTGFVRALCLKNT